MESRRTFCERCDSNRGLTVLTVNCRACGCAGISLIHGRCYLNKWPADGVQTGDQGEYQRAIAIAPSDTTPVSHSQLHAFFDRVVIINLRHRPDRLAAFQQELEQKGWPFVEPEVFEAVWGDRLPIPKEFTQGGGAFGCRQSHLAVLQRALTDGVRSLLVLEDDAMLNPGFAEEVARFLATVPDDWEGLMLGGQHHTPPEPVKPGVVRVKYGQRTHAYACRGRYLRALFERWLNCNVHIDWAMQDWQHQYVVYAPDRFLIGQRRSKSDINGRLNATNFWNPPTAGSEMPVIWLSAPGDVVRQLRQHGWHTGYRRDPSSDIDVGLHSLMRKETKPDVIIEGLRKWIGELQWECSNEMDGGQRLICTVWHPQITADMVRQATRGPVWTIEAATVEDAMRQLPAEAQSAQPSRRPDCVVLLKCPREVVEKLRAHGFHTGYWRDPATDIDNGLIRIFRDHQDDAARIPALREWLRVLQEEADAIPGGVVAVWHPLTSQDVLKHATNNQLAVISADTTDSALDYWRQFVLENSEAKSDPVAHLDRTTAVPPHESGLDIGLKPSSKDRKATHQAPLGSRAHALLSRLPDGPVIGAEVGVFDGGMSADLLTRSDLSLLMVDIWDAEPRSQSYIRTGDPMASLTQSQMSQLRTTAMERTHFAFDRRILLLGHSLRMAKIVAPNSLDFVFIDADHSYEGVAADIEAWHSRVRPGGVLAGHDYQDPNPWTQGVTRAVNEFAIRAGVAIKTGDDYTWYIIKP